MSHALVRNSTVWNSLGKYALCTKNHLLQTYPVTFLRPQLCGALAKAPHLATAQGKPCHAKSCHAKSCHTELCHDEPPATHERGLCKSG